jgi:serine kinase of HPr protein (carbohydrate metabolism regulator)
MIGRRLHASAVAIGGRGVLILGASGRGKSSLALRLIDRGAVLIADDQVELAARGGRLQATALATIFGKLEVRGIGLVDCPAGGGPIALAVDLDALPERLPEPAAIELEGVAIPIVALAPFDADAPIKVELALKRFGLTLEEAPS